MKCYTSGKDFTFKEVEKVLSKKEKEMKEVKVNSWKKNKEMDNDKER